MDACVISHFVIDRVVKGERGRLMFGGPPVYCGFTLSSLGLRVGIVSKVGKGFVNCLIDAFRNTDVPIPDLEGVKEVNCLTTSFEIKEENDARQLRLVSLCDKLSFEDVPEKYLKSKFMVVSPVYHEVSPKMVEKLGAHRVFLDVQGFLRCSRDGLIILNRRVFPWTVLRGVYLLKGSQLEIETMFGRKSFKKIFKEASQEDVNILVMTKGKEGVAIGFEETIKEIKVPSISNQVNSTGAGDVFLGGMIFSLLKGKDPFESALVGSYLASERVKFMDPINFLTKLPNLLERKM